MRSLVDFVSNSINILNDSKTNERRKINKKERYKMNKNLSKMVEELEMLLSGANFAKANYRAMAILFYHGMKNEWVKDRIRQADLPLSFGESITKEEVDDYISHIKSIEKRRRIRTIIDKLDNDSDKAFLLDELMKNKKEVS